MAFLGCLRVLVYAKSKQLEGMKWFFGCLLIVLLASCHNDNKVVLDERLLREDLVKMDYHNKTETYLSLSPSSKRRLWECKLKYNLHSPYLTCREKIAMIKMLWLLNEDMFSEDESKNDVVKQKNRVKRIVEKLNWPAEKQFVFLERYETVEELKVSGFLSSEHKTILLKYSSDEILRFITFFSDGIAIDSNGGYVLNVSEEQRREYGIPKRVYKKVDRYILEKNPLQSTISKEELVKTALLE